MESGGTNDRPELEKALNLARLTGATLIIAKLDRLTRNAAFLLTLQGSGVRFLACDMPEANDLTFGIMALVAQQEREAISRRTKAALAAAKARGVKLGNPNGAAALRRAGKGGVAPREVVAQNADVHAVALAPVIEALQGQGHTTLRAIATELNAAGMQMPEARWVVGGAEALPFGEGSFDAGIFEAPRVSERLFRLSFRQLFQGRRFLRGMPPRLLAAVDGQWRCVAARCCTS